MVIIRSKKTRNMNNNFENIIDVLGKPFYKNNHVILYNMDCREGISKLAYHSIEIDSTITSPPYNIGKEYEKILSVEEYVNWLSDILNRIYDITKSNGSLLLNLGYLEVKGKGNAIPIAYLIWNKLNFYLNQEIIWNYGAGIASKKYLSPRNEKILWYIKNSEDYTFNLDDIRDPDVKYPHQKKNGKLRCNTIGKNPSDVWQIAKVTSGKDRSSPERTSHPAQFPEDLITRMVLGFTKQEDLILDPFIGSGTTAKTAMLNNRFCIGFEINDAYSEIIKTRIKETEKQIKEKESIITLF
jgi:adenine-specific DNA-methyltransferase